MWCGGRFTVKWKTLGGMRKNWQRYEVETSVEFTCSPLPGHLPFIHPPILLIVVVVCHSIRKSFFTMYIYIYLSLYSNFSVLKISYQHVTCRDAIAQPFPVGSWSFFRITETIGAPMSPSKASGFCSPFRPHFRPRPAIHYCHECNLILK